MWDTKLQVIRLGASFDSGFTAVFGQGPINVVNGVPEFTICVRHKAKKDLLEIADKLFLSSFS